jgi:protein-L-isoaspartate(D-aspartate) O-methyltransferase
LKLADYLRKIGTIKNSRVYEAFSIIDRATFLPETVRKYADEDRVIPTYEEDGYSISTNSQPSLVAAMIELLRLQGSEKVLEVGTGTGYCTALLASVAKNGKVYSIDVISELIAVSRTNLDRAGVSNAVLKNDDGFYGWTEEAPFDAMIATVAIGEIPAFLFDQMKIGSRFVCPVYVNHEDTPVYVFVRESETVVRGRLHIDAVFIAMGQHRGVTDSLFHSSAGSIVFEKNPETGAYSTRLPHYTEKKELF